MITSKHVADQIIEGVRPAEIAKNLATSTVEVLRYLSLAVMEGHIRRSDIFNCFPDAVRENAHWILSSRPTINLKVLKAFPELENLEDEEIAFISLLYQSRFLWSDMYELVSELERTLHSRVRNYLTRMFRRPTDAWWRKGIPLTIRQSCLCRHEEDEFAEEISDIYVTAFGYTTFIELSKIILRNWSSFEKCLPNTITTKGGLYNPDGQNLKPKLERDLTQLNWVRNQIMHPIRGESLDLSDYHFVRRMHQLLVIPKWK